MSQLGDQHDTGASYRLYRLGEDGHIKTCIVIPAQSDEEALAKAIALPDSGARELWDRARLIKRLPPGSTYDHASC